MCGTVETLESMMLGLDSLQAGIVDFVHFLKKPAFCLSRTGGDR